MTTQTTNSATQQTASGVDSTDNGLDSRIDGVPTELIVGGQRRPASDRGTFPVLDPATGKTLADVANGTEADALACVDAAEAALRTGPRRHLASAARFCGPPSS